MVDEIAQSPAVTEAISRQSVGFANQMAGVARERSRTADARLERIAARLTRRPPRTRGPCRRRARARNLMAVPDVLPAAGTAQLDLGPVSPNGGGPSSGGDVEYAGLVTRAIAIVADALLIDAAALLVTGAVLLLDPCSSVSNGTTDLAVAIGGVPVRHLGGRLLRGLLDDHRPDSRQPRDADPGRAPRREAHRPAPGAGSARLDGALAAALLGLPAGSLDSRAGGPCSISWRAQWSRPLGRLRHAVNRPGSRRPPGLRERDRASDHRSVTGADRIVIVPPTAASRLAQVAQPGRRTHGRRRIEPRARHRGPRSGARRPARPEIVTQRARRRHAWPRSGAPPSRRSRPSSRSRAIPAQVLGPDDRRAVAATRADGAQSVAQAGPGQQGRVDAMGEQAHLVDRCPRRRIPEREAPQPRPGHALERAGGQPELEPQRHETLLGTVVEVALDLLAGVLLGGEAGLARVSARSRERTAKLVGEALVLQRGAGHTSRR